MRNGVWSLEVVGLKKRRQVVIALALVLALCIGTVSANAATLSELREQISEKQSELEKGQEQEKSLSKKLNELEQAIGENEEKLTTLEAELKEAQEKVETQTENLNSRLRNMYKNGSVGFLDVLMDSSSFSEFLTNLDMVKIIYSSDKDVLNDLQEAHDQVEEKKEEVETLQAELEESRAVVSEEKESIAASNEETEKMLDELQADADKLTAELQQQAGSSGSSKYTGGTMAWPVPSVGTSNITSLYGYRIHPIIGVGHGHSGVDIGASYGSSVVAANAGTVIYAGWYGGYGNCVMIDHGGGIVTLYGHNSAFNVSVGQSVSRGQTIAFIGSTGNSTGPHCHFEVRINGSTTDPLDYIL